MKLVREHINEKFEEKSDPIEDMGIGIIPMKEVKKLCSQLQNKFNDLFPNNVKVSLQTYRHENSYEIYINFKNTGYKFWIYFFGTKDAAHKYYLNNAPIIKKVVDNKKIPLKTGWYVENRMKSDIKYIETTDFDKLIEAIFKANISDYWHADNIVQKHKKEIEKLTKKIEIIKTNIDAVKTIEKILRSK
jgi:hypothetical protein